MTAARPDGRPLSAWVDERGRLRTRRDLVAELAATGRLRAGASGDH